MIACGGFVLILAMLIGHILGRHCGAKMIEQLSQLRSFYVCNRQWILGFGLSVQRQQQFLGMLNQLVYTNVNLVRVRNPKWFNAVNIGGC